jgi:hypothetical protein
MNPSYNLNFKPNAYDSQNQSITQTSYKETTPYQENNSNYSENSKKGYKLK